MTKHTALSIIDSLDDDNTLSQEELCQLFAAIYGRLPDDQDEEVGLWSLLCCAAGGEA